MHDVGSQQQLPNANGTRRVNSRPFTCLTDVETQRSSPHLTMKWLLSQLSSYLWSLEKGGRYILKICNSLTFPLIFHQIKAQSVHLKPIFRICLNMFWSTAKLIKFVPVSKYL